MYIYLTSLYHLSSMCLKIKFWKRWNIIGSRVEEVTTSIFAISKLLYPYKWASVFISLLPVDLIDIIEYHVLCMANEICLNEIGYDPRMNFETEKENCFFYNNEMILLFLHPTIKL